jgi:hypothetical protein
MGIITHGNKGELNLLHLGSQGYNHLVPNSTEMVRTDDEMSGKQDGLHLPKATTSQNRHYSQAACFDQGGSIGTRTRCCQIVPQGQGSSGNSHLCLLEGIRSFHDGIDCATKTHPPRPGRHNAFGTNEGGGEFIYITPCYHNPSRGIQGGTGVQVPPHVSGKYNKLWYRIKMVDSITHSD